MRLQASVASASVEVVAIVVEVTGPGISDPYIYNIPVVDGVGSGIVSVSAGSDRKFLAQAVDGGGIITHLGEATVDVMAGVNPTLHLTLFAVDGDIHIEATLQNIMVEVMPPLVDLSVGDEVKFSARVTNALGNPVDLPTITATLRWGSSNPALVSVDENGLATALQGGQVQIVANVGPVASEPAIARVDRFGFDELTEFMRQANPPRDALEIKRTLPDREQPEVVMTARFMGRGELVELGEGEIEEPQGPRASEGPIDPAEIPPDDAKPDNQMLHVFNTATRNEFQIAASADLLRVIHGIREAAGLTEATEGVDDPEKVEGGIREGPQARVKPQARSNGVDTRIIRAPTTLWPWRTISHFSIGCTGTLIGPRHIITAAHCVNRAGTNVWYSFTVRPGRDGDGANKEPFGASKITPNPAPGDPFRWYFTPSPWRNPSTANRGQWDWALIIIPDRLGENTGWMGYVARPGSQLGPQTHFNRGYPGCGGPRPDVPVGCQPRRLYGDLNRCRLGPFSFPGPTGWNRLIDHSCDTSGGQSGSPVYHYIFSSKLGKWVPVVAMVHRASRCDFITRTGVTIFCGPGDNTPSISRRIDPAARWLISFFRAWRP
jgi:V8-like Glu-specific endopeptidase